MEKEIKEIIKATSMDKFERKLVIKLLLNLLIQKESEEKETIPEFLGNDPIDQLNNLF
jgi:hypothetical protein